MKVRATFNLRQVSMETHNIIWFIVSIDNPSRRLDPQPSAVFGHNSVSHKSTTSSFYHLKINSLPTGEFVCIMLQ